MCGYVSQKIWAFRLLSYNDKIQWTAAQMQQLVFVSRKCSRKCSHSKLEVPQAIDAESLLRLCSICLPGFSAHNYVTYQRPVLCKVFLFAIVTLPGRCHMRRHPVPTCGVRYLLVFSTRHPTSPCCCCHKTSPRLKSGVETGRGSKIVCDALASGSSLSKRSNNWENGEKKRCDREV